MEDGGVLRIEADFFCASDWHTRYENLVSWSESTDVRESCVHFVGATNGHACACLDGKPDNGGDPQENKGADRQFDGGLLHLGTGVWLRLVRAAIILLPASHDAICGGDEVCRGS